MVAALKEPVQESEDENEGSAETENDGPLYQLFDALYNETNSLGMPNKSLGNHFFLVTNNNNQKHE